MRNTILVGDCLESMRRLPDACVSMCVTSPPYYALRDYGTGSWEGGDESCDHTAAIAAAAAAHVGDKGDANKIAQQIQAKLGLFRDCPSCGATRIDKQIGLEKSPKEYVAKLVAVFAEVHRILHPFGTLWLNLGDTYGRNPAKGGSGPNGKNGYGEGYTEAAAIMADHRLPESTEEAKEKDLMGIPWAVAFALRDAGWYLRSDIIWNKINAMPESVTDRPTKSHEYMFLLAKQPRYFYDADAIREESVGQDRRAGRNSSCLVDKSPNPRKGVRSSDPERFGLTRGSTNESCTNANGKNKRSVWSLPLQPYASAHFATYPPELIKPCILAGTSERGNCPACGAPWQRVTEREQLTRERPNDYVKRSGEEGTGNSCANSVAGVEVKTIGWQPMCDCNAGEPVKPIVFDPFGGSGTTGQVSRAYGRDWLLCELNPEYVELAEKRIRTPLYDSTPKQAESSAGQLGLFE